MNNKAHEVFETFSEEQKRELYYMIGLADEKGLNPRDLDVYYNLINNVTDDQRKLIELLIDEVARR